MKCDVLAVRELGLSPLTWSTGGDDLRAPESEERKKYVAAIKAADTGDIEPQFNNKYCRTVRSEFDR